MRTVTWRSTVLPALCASVLLIGAVPVVWAETDHAALALQYEEEAKALRGKAEEHRAMLKRYEGPTYAKARRQNTMQHHCTALIESYEAAAAKAEALAKDHRESAGEN